MPLENGLWKISLADLAERAKQRPEGYVREVLSRAVKVDDAHYWLTDEARIELVHKYGQKVAPEQIGTVEARKAICAQCPDNQGIRDYERNGFRIATVQCRDCGCNGAMSLLNGSCKLNKWPDGPGGS